MLRYKILLLALVALFVTESVKADERFLPYIKWVEENSDYEYNGEPLPKLVLMSPEMMMLELYGPEVVAQAEYNGYELPPVLGIYDAEKKRMILQDDGNPWAQEDVIVHEIFHYMQDINGARSDCPGIDEPEAYKGHWKWVEEHGRQADFKEPNWLFVFIQKMDCQDRHHSRYTADSPP